MPFYLPHIEAFYFITKNVQCSDHRFPPSELHISSTSFARTLSHSLYSSLDSSEFQILYGLDRRPGGKWMYLKERERSALLTKHKANEKTQLTLILKKTDHAKEMKISHHLQFYVLGNVLSQVLSGIQSNRKSGEVEHEFLL